MKITLPNGDVKEFANGASGLEIAQSISSGLARAAVGIEVNGEKYDLSRKIDSDASVRILTFDDAEGKEIYWHSSAHLMAEAIQEMYPGVKFGIGPSIDNGFYYDVDLPEGSKITVDDLPAIEKKMKELVKKKSAYTRKEMNWEDAVEYFKKVGDEYKLELLDGLQGEEITFYEQGEFTDLCRGVHVPNTGIIKSIKLLSVAGAYWRGDADRKMMTRIYGISFPKKKMLDEHLEFLEEAKRRDHRKLGKELDLFTINPMVGLGLALWMPKGAVLRRKVEEFMRNEQIRRGYQEVITPHIGNLNLYRTSGHYPYYKDSQFPPMEVDDEAFMMKPMNCPHHHMVYLNKPKSYRDLPLRYFEYGTVYRYEQSGELSGLHRVRGFTQDDAHIYCTVEQIKSEVKNVVDLIQYFFKTFGMQYSARLSFRDDDDSKYGGDIKLWETAQQQLKEAAEEMNLDYEIVEGEAAFYGPKIDFDIKDALGRNGSWEHARWIM